MIPAPHSGGQPTFSAGRWAGSSAAYLVQIVRGEPGALQPGLRDCVDLILYVVIRREAD